MHSGLVSQPFLSPIKRQSCVRISSNTLPELDSPGAFDGGRHPPSHPNRAQIMSPRTISGIRVSVAGAAADGELIYVMEEQCEKQHDHH